MQNQKTMEEQKQPKKRGGARPNAGRKRLYAGGKRYAFNADVALTEVMEAQKDKTAFVHRCIEEHLNRKANADAMALPNLRKLGQPYAMIPDMCDSKLPFMDVAVKCGLPAEVFADEYPVMTDLLPMLCPNSETSYMVVANGDSMIDANIQSGDLVIVDMSQRMPVSRKPMLCELNGGYTVKYVRHLSDGYWLQPANPTFADIPVEEDDDFKIWGVVTSVVHRF